VDWRVNTILDLMEHDTEGVLDSEEEKKDEEAYNQKLQKIIDLFCERLHQKEKLTLAQLSKFIDFSVYYKPRMDTTSLIKTRDAISEHLRALGKDKSLKAERQMA
jgi:hypothetical protein